MWEDSVNINDVQEIRTRTKIFFGCGAINKIADIAKELKARGIDSVLVTSGKGAYRKTGAWAKVEAALLENGIRYALFDKVTPNPTTEQVDTAVALGREANAQAVISIGGGSPIDTGKSAAILLAYPGRTAAQLYEYEFAPEKAVPVVAINLTHGTGTETNRVAVVTLLEKEFKPAIAYDCIYPEWSIDDPALMTGLSPEQTRFVSIDAVNHVVEAASSKIANPLTLTLSAETIRLIAKYLPKAMANPADLEARYFLLYASMIAGMAFDNSLLHYTHALEHPLSAVKPELTHGLGLALLLPAVVEDIYPVLSGRMASILAPIVPGLKGEPGEALAAACGVEDWLASCGVTQKLTDEGFTEKDVDRLVELTFSTPSLSLLLSLAPTEATPERVRSIYTRSLTPLKNQ